MRGPLSIHGNGERFESANHSGLTKEKKGKTVDEKGNEKGLFVRDLARSWRRAAGGEAGHTL